MPGAEAKGSGRIFRKASTCGDLLGAGGRGRGSGFWKVCASVEPASLPQLPWAPCRRPAWGLDPGSGERVLPPPSSMSGPSRRRQVRQERERGRGSGPHAPTPRGRGSPGKGRGQALAFEVALETGAAESRVRGQNRHDRQISGPKPGPWASGVAVGSSLPWETVLSREGVVGAGAPS